MWKGAATGNPFQLVANYSQVGDRQVREAAKRLQRGRGMLGVRRIRRGKTGDGWGPKAIR